VTPTDPELVTSLRGYAVFTSQPRLKMLCTKAADALEAAHEREVTEQRHRVEAGHATALAVRCRELDAQLAAAEARVQQLEAALQECRNAGVCNG
jgi:hypothetical protein